MITEEKLKVIIESALEDRSRIDCQEHQHHHEFISEFIEQERMKRERWEQIQRQVLGWGIIAIAGTVGSIVARKFGVDL